MSDENDSQAAAAAEPSEDRSSKKKDKSSKKRKESSSESSADSGKSKKKDSKSDKSEKSSREKSKEKKPKKKEDAASAADRDKDGKPKAKKGKGKKGPLFYGTNEDRWLLRRRDLSLRQASIKRLIRAILQRNEMLSSVRLTRNAVIALHTLVNVYVQERFKAARACMKAVNPKRATLSVNYVISSYVTGEMCMGRTANLEELEFLPLPEKKGKIQNGPYSCFLEDHEKQIREDLTKDDKEPKESEVKKEASKRYDALSKTEKKKYEKRWAEKEEAEGKKKDGKDGKSKKGSQIGKKKDK